LVGCSQTEDQQNPVQAWLKTMKLKHLNYQKQK